MNKHNRHPNVPSLSTLLIPNPPIIVIDDDIVEHKQHNHHHVNSNVSPLLSPIDSSYASSVSSQCSSLPSPNMLSANQAFLPPLQGDDPPKRLKRHPSISSMSSINSSFSTSSQNTKPTLWHVSTPSISPMIPPPTSPFPLLSPSIPFSSLPSPSLRREPPPPPPPPKSPSPSRSMSRSPSPIVSMQDQRPPLPPSTQIIVNEKGETILKRRRGRPPSLREPSLEGGWTFLTPTVWDVKYQQQHPGPLEDDARSVRQQQQQQQSTASVNHGQVAAFSSSDPNMSLHMPRKKRGRKPKTHIVGNSCFVWKDISATRRTTKAMKLAQQQQQQQQQHDEHATAATTTRLRRIEQVPTNI